MRYTESRMFKLASEMSGHDKETVDFNPTTTVHWKTIGSSNTVSKPLVNGSSGIAVGMATNIAPHNLSEVIDGTIALFGIQN